MSYNMSEQYPFENDATDPYPQAPPPVRNEVRWVLRYGDRDNPNTKIVLVAAESVYEPHGTLSLPGGVREIGETFYGTLRRTFSELDLEEEMPDPVPLGVVCDPDAGVAIISAYRWAGQCIWGAASNDPQLNGVKKMVCFCLTGNYPKSNMIDLYRPWRLGR